LQELEIALDEERRSGDEARQAVAVLERKRIALQTELEDIRALLETVRTTSTLCSIIRNKTHFITSVL